MRPQGSKLVPHPQMTLEMDIPLLGSHSSGGSDDSDSPSAPRTGPPRAQCSCTDGWRLFHHWESGLCGEKERNLVRRLAGPPGVPIIKHSRSVTFVMACLSSLPSFLCWNYVFFMLNALYTTQRKLQSQMAPWHQWTLRTQCRDQTNPYNL